jgi:hypothetical protein
MGQLALIYLTNFLDLRIYLFTNVFVFLCHHSMAVLRLQMEERPPICRVNINVLNKQSWTARKVWFSALRAGQGLISKRIHIPRVWTDPRHELSKAEDT